MAKAKTRPTPSKRSVIRYTSVSVKKVNNGYVISAHNDDYSKEKEMIASTKITAQEIANKLLKIK